MYEEMDNTGGEARGSRACVTHRGWTKTEQGGDYKWCRFLITRFPRSDGSVGRKGLPYIRAYHTWVTDMQSLRPMVERTELSV